MGRGPEQREGMRSHLGLPESRSQAYVGRIVMTLCTPALQLVDSMCVMGGLGDGLRVIVGKENVLQR